MIAKELRMTIENITDLEELNRLVCFHIFKTSCTDKKYSTNAIDCEELIDRYSDSIILNTLSKGIENVGWHCNIRGIHSVGSKTLKEAVCKASLIYELGLWTESEEYQNKLEKLDIGSEEYGIIQNKIWSIEDKKHIKERNLNECSSN